MNPHAKEFVPAHLLKRRQEEEGNELAEKVGQVDLQDDSRNQKPDGATSGVEGSGDSTNTATTTTKTNNVAEAGTTTPNSNNADQPPEPQHNHPNNVKNTSHHPNHHNNTNGLKQDLETEDDRHLLKAGETYCEFNGEQFIIPGEDDEYESDQQEYPKRAGYDFGNAEDNEDEDVCNAYEEFLGNLPE